MNLKLHNKMPECFIPDGIGLPGALQRVTHLGIGAHQDDLEFMAFHAISECYRREDRWFGGVTCTDGAGSARTGKFEAFSDEEMKQVRFQEQNSAAKIGQYGAMIQLGYPSAAIKRGGDPRLHEELLQILSETRPEVVYTHNPADKHETHVAVMLSVIKAIRIMPREQRPGRVIGCEVWRDLDWLPDEAKVLMDVTGNEELAKKLNEVFESQVAGGKRYDRAVIGRRAANATFFDSHHTDQMDQLIFGMDLTPLVSNEALEISQYVSTLIDQFRQDVIDQLV